VFIKQPRILKMNMAISYQRPIRWEGVNSETLQSLEKHHQKINPIEMKKVIEYELKRIFTLAKKLKMVS
jgi:hypothetical protein